MSADFFRFTIAPISRYSEAARERCSGGAIRAEDVHGGNGLGGVELHPVGKRPEKADAAEGLFRTAQNNPGLKIVTLGPLTNIAVAFNLFPRLKRLVSGIVIMGGAIGPGNVTPYAEFNFAFDPEAVTNVLGLGVPLKILTWDATTAMPMSEEEFFALDMSGTETGDLLLEIQRHYINYKERTYGTRMVHFPDPLAMACVINPETAVERETMPLKMVLSRGSEKRGASVKVSDTDEADGSAEVVLKCSPDCFIPLLKRIRNHSID